VVLSAFCGVRQICKETYALRSHWDSSSIIFPLKRIGLILGEELLVLSAFCGVRHICGEREREQESKNS